MRDFKEPFYEGKQCKCCKPNESQPASFTNIAFDTGVIAERERIIKLLETKVLKNVSPDVHSLELLHNQLVNSLIALIKGENK